MKNSLNKAGIMVLEPVLRYNGLMDKFIGIILMGIVIAILFYIFMNLDKLNNIVIPVPEKVIEYFKQKPFETNFNNSTTTP